MVSVLFSQEFGQADISSIEVGMDLINYHFHLILNR
jgi:hypothetical protein